MLVLVVFIQKITAYLISIAPENFVYVHTFNKAFFLFVQQWNVLFLKIKLLFMYVVDFFFNLLLVLHFDQYTAM